MYKPMRLAGRKPRRRRSKGREAAEPCPTVGSWCSSPGTVAPLAWYPQPFPRPGRPHTHGHGDCSTCGQTSRQGYHRDVHTSAGGAGGPANPRGPPRAPLRQRSARRHGHGPARGSWRRGATNATQVGCPALNGEREASARCTMTMNSKARAFGPQPSRPARAVSADLETCELTQRRRSWES
jgi:hypothetical protein